MTNRHAGLPESVTTTGKKVQTAFVNGRLMLQDGRIYLPAHQEVPMPGASKETQESTSAWK